MIIVQTLMERLRPLVGSTGWDFCVLWKLSEDQRLVEWIDCCCSGAEHNEIGGEECDFPVSPCRDIVFQHPKRTKACELLADIPSSMPLESRIYAHAFMSYQPRWLNFAHSSDSKVEEETIGTKVLIPFPGGLIELFVTKQVPEDQQTIEFITSQFSTPFAADSLSSVGMETNFSILPDALNDLHSRPQLIDPNGHIDSPAQLLENLNLHDASGDRICMYETTIGGSYDTYVANKEMNPPGKVSAGDGFQEMHAAERHPTEQVNTEWQGNDEESLKPENGTTKSTSDCSDQNEDDDERNNKQPHSKNLQAERRRRKKLNDRLYHLRSLVPNISKLDRASILGDAIEYIMELLKQQKELQDELEEQSDVEDPRNSGSSSNFTVSQPEVFDIGVLSASEKAASTYQLPGNTQGDGFTKRNRESETTFDKQQRMEVEVRQMDENEFLIKVFGEHRPGGFVRLMEALDSIGLEVTNANVTRFLSLVSNVFTVEKKDSELMQPDFLKDSLLELTRNPTGMWPGPSKAMENGSARNGHGHQHHYHLLHNHLF